MSQRQLVAVGSSSFLASSDGGGTWRSVPVPAMAALAGAFVFDRSHWWAASASTGSNHVTVARSADGGLSWQRSTLPATYPDGYGGVYFSFKDARHGWLTVGTVHSSAFAGADLYSTSDSGASWRHLGTFPFSGPILFRDGRGYALAGVGGQTLQTTGDEGRSWHTIALPIPKALRQRTRTLALLTTKHGVAVEQWFAQTSMKYPVVLLVETSSDGRSWRSTTPLTANFGDYGVGATLPISAAPGGGWLVTNGFEIFRSTAKGWTSRRTSNLLSTTMLAFPSRSIGFALVAYGHCREYKRTCTSNSVVAQTPNGGRTWTALALDGGLGSAPPCQPSQLKGSAGFGGATGSQLGSVVLANTSSRACVLADTPPQVTLSWQGTVLPTKQKPWPSSSSDLLHAPVRVLAPHAAATIAIQWFNWCGSPNEATRIEPSLVLQFATGAKVTVTAQPMIPARCDAPNLASTLNVSMPLTPQ